MKSRNKIQKQISKLEEELPLITKKYDEACHKRSMFPDNFSCMCSYLELRNQRGEILNGIKWLKWTLENDITNK